MKGSSASHLSHLHGSAERNSSRAASDIVRDRLESVKGREALSASLFFIQPGPKAPHSTGTRRAKIGGRVTTKIKYPPTYDLGEIRR